MSNFTRLDRALRTPHPLAEAARRKGRMDISGTQVLDEFGRPWVGRGAVLGHGELANDTDLQTIADMGMNFVRIGVRWWTNPDVDGEDDTQTTLLRRDYIERTRNRFLQARAAGLKTLLFFDSNCGQTERVGDEICALGLGSPQTWWTVGGQAKLDGYEQMMRMTMRTLCGLVDFVEPIVEPGPATTIPTGDLETDVKLVQERLMKVVQAEDPYIIFWIGPAPSYVTGKIGDWVEPAWIGKYKIVYTANMLDSGSTSPDRLNKIDQITAARDLGVPVGVQQVGTKIPNDPGDRFLTEVLAALNNPRGGGGSISWTFWEMLSPGPNGYGWLWGDATNRTLIPLRQGTLQAAAAAPRVYG